MKIPAFARRITPFYLLFIVVGALTRCVLLLRESSNIDGMPLAAAKALAMGLVMDTATFAYFLLPLSLLPLFLPRQARGGRWGRRLSAGVFFLFCFSILFTAVSEWFFWDEFSSRFNFISVDYLVYTHEVIGNIYESYPVVLISAVLALAAALLTWAYAIRPVDPAVSRTGVVVTTAIAVGVSFFVADSRWADVSDNNYVNQIARNGSYEFFSAYRHNELPFEKFYATEDEESLLSNLQDEFGVQTPGHAVLTRHIEGKGAEKDYNVVLITVESLSADYMAAFGNPNNLTPNLDSLARESLFFTNLYATGTRTVYGLSALTLSIPPMPGNSIVRRPQNEGLFSLASVFNAKGYDSKFIYGGYGYFDNMNYFFEHNGYKIVDRTNMAKDEVHFGNIWGVADEDLFARVLKENDAAAATGKPFFDMVMTTSNHRPYTYPDGRIDIPSGTGRYGGVKYTDHAIGEFLATAGTRPWFDKTVFVIIADHTAGSAGKQELNPEGYHIPMLVYAPRLIEPRKIDKLVSQIDVAPTILSLLNMSYESRFYGQDILDDNAKERAFISNYLQLGYIDRERLVVFKPVKQVMHYTKEQGRFVVDPTPDLKFAAEGLTFFQSASYWKKWSRAINDGALQSQKEILHADPTR